MKPQTILITGVNGFVGHHVAQKAYEAGHSVIGVGNQAEEDKDVARYLSSYIACDLTDKNSVANITLREVDAIVNLAGLANVGDSIGKGAMYNKINVGVHTVLYDACIEQGVSPRVVAVSTGAVYDPAQPLPLSETSKLVEINKTNEYVISKQIMEKALEPYIESGLRIIIARPFNHSGPGQQPGFLLPDLGEQILQAKSLGGALHVGNLKTKRDYTDVRDVARAYILLATLGDAEVKQSVYNICSGMSVSGEKVLLTLLDTFDARKIEVIIDQNKLRKNDVMDIYGSYQRLAEDTGWKPEHSLEQMIKDFADWRLQIA